MAHPHSFPQHMGHASQSLGKTGIHPHMATTCSPMATERERFLEEQWRTTEEEEEASKELWEEYSRQRNSVGKGQVAGCSVER